MTRFRLRTGPAALFGAMLLVILLALLPLRLVLGAAGVDAMGLSARAVTGSIWSGTLREARIGRLPLGDLDASVSPLALLLGRARVTLDGEGTQPGRALHGVVTMARHRIAVSDLTAGLAAGTVFQPLPVTAIDLDEVTVRFEDGRCAEAAGRIRATLGAGPAGIALPPQIAGPVRCDAGALVLPLEGQAGAESVMLRIEGDGRYRAAFTLPAPDPAAGERLAALGFVGGAGGRWTLIAEGRF